MLSLSFLIPVLWSPSLWFVPCFASYPPTSEATHFLSPSTAVPFSGLRLSSLSGDCLSTCYPFGIGYWLSPVELPAWRCWRFFLMYVKTSFLFSAWTYLKPLNRARRSLWEVLGELSLLRICLTNSLILWVSRARSPRHEVFLLWWMWHLSQSSGPSNDSLAHLTDPFPPPLHSMFAYWTRLRKKETVD